jgi:hypothetical protein
MSPSNGLLSAFAVVHANTDGLLMKLLMARGPAGRSQGLEGDSVDPGNGGNLPWALDQFRMLGLNLHNLHFSLRNVK